MREESHLDEMRSAIRGDFERLARKRGTQELMHVEPRSDEPTSDPEPASETSREAPPEPVRRSWLDRLLSR